jgi:hypothetical protein
MPLPLIFGLSVLAGYLQGRKEKLLLKIEEERWRKDYELRKQAQDLNNQLTALQIEIAKADLAIKQAISPEETAAQQRKMWEFQNQLQQAQIQYAQIQNTIAKWNEEMTQWKARISQMIDSTVQKALPYLEQGKEMPSSLRNTLNFLTQILSGKMETPADIAQRMLELQQLSTRIKMIEAQIKTEEERARLLRKQAELAEKRAEVLPKTTTRTMRRVTRRISAAESPYLTPSELSQYRYIHDMLFQTVAGRRIPKTPIIARKVIDALVRKFSSKVQQALAPIIEEYYKSFEKPTLGKKKDWLSEIGKGIGKVKKTITEWIAPESKKKTKKKETKEELETIRKKYKIR